MKKIAIFLISLYQAFFPIRGYCRFSPTCSAYAINVISKYGVVKGGWLTVIRLMHCHPFSKSYLITHNT